MPEGHTIHRLKRDLTRDLVGDVLSTSSPQGRFASGAKQLNGLELQKVDAFGKHLFFRFERGRILHVHLGLYGRFRRKRLPLPSPQGEVRLRAEGVSRGFDLNGPSRCEILSRGRCEGIIARLGQDPLRQDADPSIVRERLRTSRAAIGRLLLDQSVIAGIGNVYRAEVLHMQNIHPNREARAINDEEFDRLWRTIVHVLRIGVKYNRIITFDPSPGKASLGRLGREERLRVYGRKHCVVCKGSVRQWTQGSRKIFACERCQPKRSDGE